MAELTSQPVNDGTDAQDHTYEVARHKLIYAFSRDDTPKLAGKLKVGDASIAAKEISSYSQEELDAAAEARIKEYTDTAGVDTELRLAELAIRHDKEGHLEGFRDYDVHRMLLNSGFSRYDDPNPKLSGREWFNDVTPEDVRAAIAAVRNNEDFILPQDRVTISLYPHQRDAVDKTLSVFKDGSADEPKRMLWNAKMRFGKTLAAYGFVDEAEDVKRVLVMTHRPAVNDSWFEDFKKSPLPAKGYRYGSKHNGSNFADMVETDSFGITSPKSEGLIWFASLQDLRLSGFDEEDLSKNHELFGMDWDLIITDEAHEGTLTKLANSVYDRLRTKYSLDLSGTPYNLTVAGDWDISGAHRYVYDDVYSWSYVDEQKAKREWVAKHGLDAHNIYEIFPEVEFRTYDISSVLADVPDGHFPSIEINELLKVGADGKFLHEKAVVALLRKMAGDDLYTKIKPESFPFHDDYQWMFRHTLWCLPSVPAVNAMEELMGRASSGFAGWNIVNATGLGNKEAAKESADALARVRKAVAGDKPSVTLSFRMLTTGISVPEWTAVFMLNNTTNAMGYMQTAFRATTPWKLPNGSYKSKAYVFDFNVDRMLGAIVEAANNSGSSGEDEPGGEEGTDATGGSSRSKIEDFLKYATVLTMTGAHFEKPSSSKILEKINEAYLEDVLEKGFESPKLFDRKKLNEFDISSATLFKALRAMQGKNVKAGEVSVSDLTEEEREELNAKLAEMRKRAAEAAEKNLPKDEELDKEIKQAQDELESAEKKERKNRTNAISILTGIACRLPMLVLAADVDEITPANFHLLVDEKSWQEFLPKNLLRIKPEGTPSLEERMEEALGNEGNVLYWEDVAPFFNEVIFTGACERIRLMAKVADSKEPFERAIRMAAMFSLFKNPDKETVLTPWRVVVLQYISTIGGLCPMDLEKSTAKEFFFYVLEEATGEVTSVPSRTAVGLVDDGTHSFSGVWVEPQRGESALPEGFVPQSRAEMRMLLEANSSAYRFWSNPYSTSYDINSKTALYPLFAAMNFHYVQSLREAGKPVPKRGDYYDPSGLGLEQSRRIWKNVVDTNVFLNCRVGYSKLIAQRVLMGFDRSQEVNATVIDVLELKAALEWWNAGGSIEPPKKGARKSSYMPDWWSEVEGIYDTIGAVLRLASPKFIGYHVDGELRLKLQEAGYSPADFQKLLKTVLAEDSQGEDPSMSKSSGGEASDRMLAVKNLLEAVETAGELPKFDLTAGNPPYQFKEEGVESKRGGKETKIYPLFWLSSLELSKQSVMIFPDGWRFASGMGSIYEAPKMRDNIHLVDVYPLGSTAFEVGISVDIVHSDSDFINDGSIKRHFLQTPKLWERLSKNYSSITGAFNGQRNNGLFGEGEFVEKKKGFPSYIHDSEVPNSIKVYHGKSMLEFWVEKNHPNFKPTNKIKLILPSTGASRAFRDSHIIQANEEYSDYWFSAFFNSIEEAENFRIYLGTKIYRYLHQKGAVSQNATKSTHKFVPDLKDYSSDNKLFKNLPNNIDAAIVELDERLKKHFEMSEEEISEIFSS